MSDANHTAVELLDRLTHRRPRRTRPTQAPQPQEQRRPAEPETTGDPGVRMELVQRIRGELKDGSYDEMKRIDSLLDALAADLGVQLTDD